jgi:ATP-dependent DNA helicase RecG
MSGERSQDDVTGRFGPTERPGVRLAELAERPVGSLSGVGPKKAVALASIGLETALDLLLHTPRRYLDRTREAAISDLLPGESAMVLGRITRCEARRVRGNRVMVTASLSDGRNQLKLSFFNQAWRERQLAPGTEAVVFGKVELFNGSRQMTNPVVDLVGNKTGRILAVYPHSEKSGLSTWEISEWTAQVVRRCATRGLADPVDSQTQARLGLIGRHEAFAAIHLPDEMADTVAARRRLVFDELLRLQVSLVRAKVAREANAVGVHHAVEPGTGAAPGLVAALLDSLPFTPTAAQQRVMAEIAADLRRPGPMHRLVQGDVGSGKTLVALAALLTAVQGGHQGAFMAPTEVLAHQHFANLRRLTEQVTVDDPNSLLDAQPVRIEVLTGRVPAAQRRRLLADLESGSVHLLVGTHALIQESVRWHSLGVAVIDEQHRFGVHQRDALRAVNPDGTEPDVLVMTATPIPRTAAMTVYGDLDVSVLDELPPGRQPIVTQLVAAGGEAAVWADVRERVARGERAFVVCPLIEESDKLEAASANETFERLASGELSGLRLGLLHGRMSGVDKDSVMTAFAEGELDVLVATTVIEVGVDVPRATAMVILGADRFGIAQLHQLRGRVGRGSDSSVCWLVPGGEPADDGSERLQALVRTTDGFELAEVDLDLRGEGTILGQRQKGLSDLRLASLRRDREWVLAARDVALGYVGDGTRLDSEHPLLVEEIELLHPEAETEFLLKN